MNQLPQETWDRLVALFRGVDTPNFTAAARELGISVPTVRRAYRSGYPNASPPRPPIETILNEEKIAARAAMAGTIEDEARRRALEETARARREAEKARQDAVEARRQEAQMVRSQRGNILALIGISGTVLRGALKLADTIRTELEGAAAGESKMTIEQKMVILTRTGLLTQRIAAAAGDVVKMERLLLGEPTEILAHKDLKEVDFDAAIAELERSAEVAKRIRERRSRKEAFKLRLVAGGKAS